MRPAGAEISVARTTPGLPGPARLGALARRPEAAVGLERRDADQLDRPVRPSPQAPHRHRRLRLAPRDRRGRLLRRHVLARRQARVGVGRRPERRPRLLGRQRAAGDRADPHALLPGRAGLWQDSARRPHLRRQQPLGRGGRDQPARPLGDGDRPEVEPRRQDHRPRLRAAALRRRVRPQRPPGVRDELDGALGVGDRHAHGARAPPHPALAADQPATGRPSQRDRGEPAPQRGLHGQRQHGHRLGHRHAPRARHPHDGRRSGARRAHRRDAERPRREPGRAAAVRRARGRERDRRARPRPPQADRVHPDGVEPDRRRHDARRQAARDHERERRRPARAPLRGPLRRRRLLDRRPRLLVGGRDGRARGAASASCARPTARSACASSPAPCCATTASARGSPASRRTSARSGTSSTWSRRTAPTTRCWGASARATAIRG